MVKVKAIKVIDVVGFFFCTGITMTMMYFMTSEMPGHISAGIMFLSFLICVGWSWGDFHL